MKRHWKNLRESFIRCNTERKKLTSSGSQACKLPTRQFFEILRFLEDSETYDDNDDIIVSNVNTSQPPSDQKSKSETSNSRRPLSKKRKSNSEELDQALLSSLNNVNTQLQEVSKESNRNEESSNFSFCKSIVELLDGLNPEQNMIARIKIQQVLFDIKYKK